MLDKGSIKTKYVGPTDTRGSRIGVTYKGIYSTVTYNHSVDDSHLYAVAEILHIPESHIVYRDDWKLGKYFDILDNPPSTLEFNFYVMTRELKIAGFNQEIDAYDFIEAYQGKGMPTVFSKVDLS